MKREEHREFRRKQLQGWKDSGLTQEAYCKREGIGLKTLQRWGRKLREPAAGLAEPMRFAPVSVTDTPLLSAPRSSRAASAAVLPPVEILLSSGRRVKLTGGLDESGFARLIRLLEVLPC